MGRCGAVVSILTGALLFAAAPSLASDVPTDEAAFTSYMREAFARALPDAEVTVQSALTLSIKRRAGTPIQRNLDNIWSYCHRNAELCESAVSDQIAKTVSILKEMEAPPVKQSLRVVIRPTSALEAMRREFKGNDPIAKPFAGGLSALCVIDTPTALRYVHNDTLPTLGVSADECLAIGKANLLGSLKSLDEVAKPLSPRAIGSIAGDPYESSRLFLWESWSTVAAKMRGQLLVATPGVDLVLYADSADPDAADALARIARKAMETVERPLSDEVFRWTPGGWDAAKH